MCITEPADVLDFVPAEFGFKSTSSQSDHSEALLSVTLQNLRKVLRHCKINIYTF